MSWSTKIFGEDLSKNYIFEMQQERFKIFKSQDLEAGNFDVTFEVEGKKLFGHKFILEPISETLKSMLSDRWTTKDEPVKIESYSYDNFYEFLCFVYSGSCNLNAENVFPMVDMAEFYAVSFLKDYCEKYILSTMKIKFENIEEMSEFADKYSLNMFMDSIAKFLRQNNREIIKDEKFSLFKKTFIEFLSTIPRDPDYYRDGNYYPNSYIKESEFFQSVYKWAEQQVNMKQEADKEEEGFNLVAAIKAELSTILPKIKFGKMKIEFLMEFVVEKGFFLSHTDFYYLFLYFERWNYIYQQKNSGNGYEESYDSDCEPPDYEDSDSDYSSYKYFGNDEDVFKAVYCLAEKQALLKQTLITAEDDNFNVADSIKADLSEVIPKVKFFNMTRKFLMDFVVSRGVITEDEANTFCDTVIKVKHYGKIIRGTFNDTLDIRSAIRKQNSCNFSQLNNTQIRFLDLKFPIPSNPSTVEKMKGVEFYLCLETDGILTLKNYSAVQRSDYLIAEMKPKHKFEIIPDEAAFLTTRHNNVVKNN